MYSFLCTVPPVVCSPWGRCPRSTLSAGVRERWGGGMGNGVQERQAALRRGEVLPLPSSNSSQSEVRLSTSRHVHCCGLSVGWLNSPPQFIATANYTVSMVWIFYLLCADILNVRSYWPQIKRSTHKQTPDTMCDFLGELTFLLKSPFLCKCFWVSVSFITDFL